MPNSVNQAFNRLIRLVCALLAAVILLAQPVLAYDVLVGGQSLGIVLKSEGAVVVGFTPVPQADGSEVYPARDAGVQLEDRLVAINGQPVNYNQEVADLVNTLGGDEPLMLTIKRGSEQLDLQATPAKSTEDEQYRLGLYIRDANAGIGTLTFYDPATGSYAALGHRIDEQGESEGEVFGHVLAADVQYVESSRQGEPGEKVGVFDNTHLNGSILMNCELGIYGKLDDEPQNPIYPQPLTVAEADEVQTGPATMLTVLEDEQIEEFAVEIERITPQKHTADKGMVIKVTDERLLAKAGGIVQGMSGSPIIQNGKLVGAVTHVFVNESSSGYACFAEWMLAEAVSLPDDL
ncbi:MAG: SpoIVB peptidase [Firmicutes bacterium]|nr:SpoIVB peptidase [Bacillota bacterium]